jgi:hypothetical protein
MRACLTSASVGVDSLRFRVVGTNLRGESLADVTADVEYVHYCQSTEATWVGQIVAVVERRRPEEGWRIRQIVETR